MGDTLYRRTQSGMEPLYPKTLASNVTASDGRTVEAAISELEEAAIPGGLETLSNEELEAMLT